MGLKKIGTKIVQVFQKGISALSRIGVGETRVSPRTVGMLKQASIAALPVSSVGRGAATVGRGVRTLWQRATANPFAGRTIPQGLKVLGGRAAGALGVIAGTEAIRAGITGDPYKPFGRRSILGALGAGLGGIPSIIAGAGVGLAELGIRKTRDVVSTIQQPPFPVIPTIDYLPQTPMIPQTPINIYTAEPMLPSFGSGAPSGVFAPSFAPSATTGGGLDPVMLALLLGGAGALGFGLGRRRRKKKKRKKYKGGKR